MITSVYDLIFDELLRSGTVQVPSEHINQRSMTSQFYKYRDRMQFADFLQNKTLQFKALPDPEWLVVTMIPSKRKTAIQFASVTYDNTNLPTSVGKNQSG